MRLHLLRAFWLFVFVGCGHIQQAYCSSPANTVLRLGYRGERTSEKAASQSTGGAFASFTVQQLIRLVGADEKGRFFISDPIRHNYSLLKCYDKNGKLVAKWSIASGIVTDVEVDPNGTIWTIISSPGGSVGEGLPLMAFRFGQSKPILDWRRNLPASTKQLIDKSLAPLGRTWKPKNSTSILRMEQGRNRLSLKIAGDTIGNDNNYARLMWVLIDTIQKKS